jgi:hypothetical protein
MFKYPMGVYYDPNRKNNHYIAVLRLKFGKIRVGSFATPEEAGEAWKKAAEEHMDDRQRAISERTEHRLECLRAKMAKRKSVDELEKAMIARWSEFEDPNYYKELRFVAYRSSISDF